MELYIVRHGKTLWNAEGRLQGHSDIALNDEGRQMAKALGERLADIPFDKIYSSPLSRAYETAELIRGDRDIPIIKDSRLMEISFGDMEGITVDEWFDEKSPYRFFIAEPEKYTAPKNGESLEAVMKRSRNFLQTEIEPLEGSADRIMIVAHGALNKGLMCHIQNHGIRDYWNNHLQENCSADIFYFENGTWRN